MCKLHVFSHTGRMYSCVNCMCSVTLAGFVHVLVVFIQSHWQNIFMRKFHALSHIGSLYTYIDEYLLWVDRCADVFIGIHDSSYIRVYMYMLCFIYIFMLPFFVYTMCKHCHVSKKCIWSSFI